MNLLCFLFGIRCRAKQSTRARFTSSSGVIEGNAEFDRLTPNTQMVLDELDLADMDDLALGELDRALQALNNDGAILAALRLTYVIGDRLSGGDPAKIVQNNQERARLQRLVDLRLGGNGASTGGSSTGINTLTA